MSTKVLRLQIKSEFSGQEAFKSLLTDINHLDTSIQKFTTTTKISSDGTKAYTHAIDLAGKSVRDLAQAEAASNSLRKEGSEAVTRQVISDTKAVTRERERASKTEIARRDALFTELASKSRNRLQARIATEKAIISDGANSLLVFKRRQAEKEILVEETLTRRLKDIKKRFASEQLSFIGQGAARNKAFEAYKTSVLNLYRQTDQALKREKLQKFAVAEAQKKHTAALKETNKAYGGINKAIGRVIVGHRSWTRQIAEGIGLYRAVSFAITGISRAILAVPKLGIELQTTKSVFAATLGSEAASAGAFEAINKEAERTGIAINVLRESFRNLNASMSLAGETTKTVFSVFTSLNTISTTLHLSSDKTRAVFLAIEQIFNKSKVQSEELVKQLGNLLPGAFAAFAEANKVSTETLAKQMEGGFVRAHEKVATFLTFYEKRFKAGFIIANQGLQSNIGRLSTSFTLLGETIFTSIEEPLIDLIKVMTSAVNGLRKMMESTELFQAAAALLGNTLIALAGGSLLKVIGKLLTYTTTTTAATTATYSFLKGITFTTAAATTASKAITASTGSVALAAAMTSKAAKATAALAANTVTLTGSAALAARAMAILRGAATLATGPIGILVTGVAALTTGFLLFRDNSRKAVTTLKEIHTSLEDVKIESDAPISLEIRIDKAESVVKLRDNIREVEKSLAQTQRRLTTAGELENFFPRLQAKELDLLKTIANARKDLALTIEGIELKQAAFDKEALARVNKLAKANGQLAKSIKDATATNKLKAFATANKLALTSVTEDYTLGLLSVEEYFKRKLELTQRDLVNQLESLRIAQSNEVSGTAAFIKLQGQITAISARSTEVTKQLNKERALAYKETELAQAQLLATLRGNQEDHDRLALLQLQKVRDGRIASARGDAELLGIIERDYAATALAIELGLTTSIETTSEARTRSQISDLETLTGVTRTEAQKRLGIELSTASSIANAQSAPINAATTDSTAINPATRSYTVTTPNFNILSGQSRERKKAKARGEELPPLTNFQKQFPNLFRFATGGSFIVGGSGGTDTTPVNFLATKGEKVSIETPAQQKASSSNGITIENLNLPNVSNPREFVEELKQMLRLDPNILETTGIRAG